MRFRPIRNGSGKRADSEKDGAIVANISSQILTPTAFSSVK